MKKKAIIRIIKYSLFALAFFFIGKYFVTNWDTITAIEVDINPWIFAGSLVLYLIYNVGLASLWHYITWQGNSAIAYGDAMSAYMTSILGKYIPGKVFMLAARFPSYDEGGVPLRRVSVYFVLENVCTLLGAGFLFLVSLFFFPNDILSDYVPMVAVCVVLFFICINPRFINIFLRLIGKLLKKEDMEIPFNYLVMLKIVLLFVINWIVSGTGFYLLVRSIYPVPGSQLLYVAGIFGLSIVIGIVSLFAPSGIGVRETVMVVGLSLVMPEEVAVIISVISRLWTTIAELLLIASGYTIRYIRKRKKQTDL